MAYQVISETECIGDSLEKINNNAQNFDTRINTLSTNFDTRINTLSTNTIPVGAVMSFAGSTAPIGWLVCNGDTIPTSGSRQGVSHTLLATLRNFLSANLNPFGQSGGNPKIPDIQGIFVRGAGTQTIGVNTYAATFGDTQLDQFRRHTHAINTTNSSATNNDGADPVRGEFPGSANTRGGNGANNIIIQDDDTQGAYTINYSGGVNDTDPGETRPANIALLYCIKY